MTVKTDLDWAQSRLHDAGAIWPRAELLRHFNDGYREFLALSHAVRRMRLLDLPGRHTYSVTYEWEDRHTSGTVRKPSRTLLAGWAQGSTLWEAEHLAGVTPSAALKGFTQEWERAHLAGDTDRHYRFSFPKNHERIYRLMWDDRVLLPISVRELDESDVAWQARVGEPQWWTTGTGRVTSVEVYAIVTDYGQAYALYESDHGLPRQVSGLRTWAVSVVKPPVVGYASTTSGDFTGRLLLDGPGVRITTAAVDTSEGFGTQKWEAEFLDGKTTFTAGVTVGTYAWESEYGAAAITLALGTIRSVVSEDRQYLGVSSDPSVESMLGRVLDWRSSDDALLVVEIIVPDTALAETDVPALIPAPMGKYLRYYVLARAFGRAGEGHSTILADHFLRRFLRGVAVMRRLADVAHKDRVYQREEVAPSSRRVARVDLPSEFPSAWR